MPFLLGLIRWLAAPLLVSSLLLGPAFAGTIKIGVLKFGTVNWELDSIKSNGFDKAAGFDLQVVDLANTGATTVALQASAVDVIVTDWLWVSRQRAEGARFTFVPFSTSVGALMLPPDSPITGLADLKGKKLGIAGGPVDKSWLVIRAFAQQRYGVELDTAAEKVFGAPPLLNEEILSGRLDAVINAWNFNAQSGPSCHCSATSLTRPGPMRTGTMSSLSCRQADRPRISWPRRMPNGNGCVRS